MSFSSLLSYLINNKHHALKELLFFCSCNTISLSHLTAMSCYVHCVAGGIPEDVDEKVLHAAFIPFGDIMDIQIPLDYETGLQIW